MKNWILGTGIIVLSLAFSKAQVLSPPDINCVTTDENSGDVSISWTNPTLDPCGPFEEYVILGSTNPGGPYQVVTTITDPAQTSFTHTGANGTVVDWYYRIFTEQDCSGATIDTSAEFTEEVFFSPDIEYVTVTDNGQVEIQWTASPSTQTIGYIISYYTGLAGNPPLPQFTAIDTVQGRTNTVYIDADADPTTQSYAYSIQGVNGCDDETAYEPEHQTVYLSQPSSVDPCDVSLLLEWNPYINWSDLLEYRVVYTVDSATTDSITLEPSDIFPSGSSADTRAQYELPLDEISGNQICVTIRAIHENGTPVSNSNELCLNLDQVSSTAYNYLTFLSVNANDEVDFNWVIDTTADISEYLIKRGIDNNTSAIDTLATGGSISFNNSYTDATANVQRESYYYNVGSIDQCGFERTSTTGRTILLQENDNGSSVVNSLSWNAFELENATVLSYNLFRISSSGNRIPLGNFSPSQALTYEDQVGTEPSDDGSYCYLVEASYQLNIPGINLSETQQSLSNVLCIEQPPVIYIPNAFVPSGQNQMFKPVLLFRELNEYEFSIYDRYGKRIFFSNKQIAGWDGSYNGEECPMGGYVYYLKIETLGGKVEERRGVVALIR